MHPYTSVQNTENIQTWSVESDCQYWNTGSPTYRVSECGTS